MSQSIDPFVLIAQVGGGSHAAHLRSINAAAVAEGPFAYVQRMADGAKRGYGRRILIGKPGGHQPFTRFPAADLMESAPFPHVAGWVENIGSALSWLTNSGEMQEVVVHVGSPEDDPHFKARENNPGAWLELLARSWAPYLRAGCGISIDSGGDTAAGSMSGIMLEWLQLALSKADSPTMIRLYTEPRAQKQLIDRLGRVGSFGINWSLHRSNPDLYADAQNMACDACFSEIICQIDNPGRQPAGFPIFDGNTYTRYKWLGPATVWAIENGMTPAFSWWRETDQQRADIIGNIREVAAKVGYAPPEEKR